VKRSVEKLVESGGRVVTVRLSPKSNKTLRVMAEVKPQMTTTECINLALENFKQNEFIAALASDKGGRQT
jgi:hypothetical protein